MDRGWTWREVAAHFNVSTRTIRRDVEAIRSAGGEVTIASAPGDATLIAGLEWPQDRYREGSGR